MNNVAMALAGFLISLCVVDACLTRDALKRSGGKIVEKNKLMLWFVKKDWRIAVITAAVSAATFAVSLFFISIGAWYASAAYCLIGIYIRGRVVIGNYLLNVKIL